MFVASQCSAMTGVSIELCLNTNERLIIDDCLMLSIEHFGLVLNLPVVERVCQKCV